MDETAKEKMLRESYRDYLAEELRSPEVQAAKKRLIETHFSKEAPFWFQPAGLVFLSAFAVLCLLGVWFFWLKPKPVILPTPRPALEQVTNFRKAPISDAPVEVRRVSSQVGTAMVYQKVAEGVPVTIVWVFNGRSFQ